MSPKRILWIETDPNLRYSIALILHRAGYSVVAKESVRAAIDALHSVPYDLVITDNDSPQLSEILLPNTQAGLHLPILIMTDHYFPEPESKAGQNNVYYLDKPATPEQLLECIATIIHH